MGAAGGLPMGAAGASSVATIAAASSVATIFLRSTAVRATCEGVGSGVEGLGTTFFGFYF